MTANELISYYVLVSERQEGEIPISLRMGNSAKRNYVSPYGNFAGIKVLRRLEIKCWPPQDQILNPRDSQQNLVAGSGFEPLTRRV